MRVAAIDCGTNSIRLLIADHDEGKDTLTDVVRRVEVVRLGEGVDTTGHLDPEALGRTLDMCREYAEQCRHHAVAPGNVRFVATSASRDASNADDFVAGVQEAFGELEVTPEEIARGTREVLAATSLDIGCVRLTERHHRTDPPTQEIIDAARYDIAEALDRAEAEVGLGGVRTVIGLAGSVTTVTAQALGLTSYDRSAIHLADVSIDEMTEACERLILSTRAECAAQPFMHPGRVDVIGAGALIWYDILERCRGANGPDLVVTASERDILDGIARSVLAPRPVEDEEATG